MSNFFKKISTIMTALSLCFNISLTSSFAVENSDFNIVKKTPEKSDNKVLVKSVGAVLILTIIGSLAWLYTKNNEADDPEIVSTNQNTELSDFGLKLHNYILENLRQYSSPNNLDLEFFKDKNSFDKDKKIDLNGFDEKNIIFVEVKSFEGMRLLGNIFCQNNKQNSCNQKKYIKAVTMGDTNTGKTRFCKYATNSELDHILQTIVDHYSIEFNDFKISLFDTSGNEKYKEVSNIYFKNIDYAFCFFNKNGEVNFNKRFIEFIGIVDYAVNCLFVRKTY